MHTVKIATSPELIAKMFTTGYQPFPFKCIEGLPKGAVLVNAFVNRYGDLELHFEHPEFPVIAEGADPTQIRPLFASLYK